MRTTALVLIVLALLAASSLSHGKKGESAPATLKLSGARPIVNAADYVSLQAACDAVPLDGGMIQLPPGTFEITQPLRVSAEDVSIVGTGTATHIKNVNTQGQPAFVLEPPAGKKSIWRVRMANFRITGNPESGDGIVARKVDEVFMHGLTVSYHGRHGVVLDACYEDPRISSCLITYNKKTGLALSDCHDIVVSANQFEENLDALTCVDGFNLCMTGNNLDDHLRHGVVIENTYGSVVAGNMIEECQGTAVVLDRDCYGITVSANVIAHNVGGGVDLRDAHGCAVSGNTFTIVPQRAVSVSANSGRITVSANNFSDSYVGDQEKRDIDDQAASGIVLDGPSDINISANSFSGLDGAAVSTNQKPSRVLIGHNLFSQIPPLPKALDEHSRISGNLGNDSERAEP